MAKVWSSPLKTKDVDPFYNWTDKANFGELLGELCRRIDYLRGHIAVKEVPKTYPYRGSMEVYSELSTLSFLCFKLTGELPSSIMVVRIKKEAAKKPAIKKTRR